MAKKNPKAKKPVDPIAKLAGRVTALERKEAERAALAATVVSSMKAGITAGEQQPAINVEPSIATRLAAVEERAGYARRFSAELLQEDFQRLRGERLATVRQSLGLSRRPWRDLLPRWLHRLLDRCGGL